MSTNRLPVWMMILGVMVGVNVVNRCTSQVAAEEPREIFLCVPQTLPATMRDTLAQRLPKLIESLPAGSALHFIEVPKHQAVATIDLKTKLTSFARRQPAFVKAWTAIGKFLKEATPSSGAGVDAKTQDRTDYVNLPAIWGLLSELRRTSAAPEVVVIGHPLYHDPREKEHDMVPNVYFSDSHLTSHYSPFGQTLGAITPGANFIIVAVESNWGHNRNHEAQVERFYRLATQVRIKGELQPITPDLASAMALLEKKNYAPQTVETLKPDTRVWKHFVNDVKYE